MNHRLVFGPAYADLVLRVEAPLLPSGVVDGSYEGRPMGVSDRWSIRDESNATIEILAPDWHSDSGANPSRIQVSGRFTPHVGGFRREIRGHLVGRFLGGMGAGYARALGGRLVSALGRSHDEPDAIASFLVQALAVEGIAHSPLYVEGQNTDWTLLVSSGNHGDKLAIGFRGCHSGVSRVDLRDGIGEIDLLVVAGFSNQVISQVLALPARVRMLAPAMRNMRERESPLASLSGRFDFLSCNRSEWDSLDGRGRILQATPIVAMTEGADGCTIDYLSETGLRATCQRPAFLRDSPPGDTNRAGEAFASTLITTLLDAGWHPGPVSEGLIRLAVDRASAAAALVLDRLDFGFPSPREIDRALSEGKVHGGDRRADG